MIDFTKIIAGEAGQRETFDELVCQIARRDPANLGIYRDAHDVPVIVTNELSGHSAALIRREALMLLTRRTVCRRSGR